MYDGVADDKTDPATTSLYNMKYPPCFADAPGDRLGRHLPVGRDCSRRDATVAINSLCGNPSDSGRVSTFTTLNQASPTSRCMWIKNVTTNTAGQVTGFNPDCCQSTSADPNTCWQCVWDFGLVNNGTSAAPSLGVVNAEHVINRGLIAGGYYFVTSYVPARGCVSSPGHRELVHIRLYVPAFFDQHRPGCINRQPDFNQRDGLKHPCCL